MLGATARGAARALSSRPVTGAAKPAGRRGARMAPSASAKTVLVPVADGSEEIEAGAGGKGH